MLLDTIRKLSPSSIDLLTVLAGEDIGQFQLAKDCLLHQVGYDSQDLTYSFFDAAETPYEEIALDLQSLPFLADKKVVIVENVLDITTAKKGYWTDEQLRQIEAYIEQPHETVRLILLASGKLDNKRRLVKMLRREATILEANPLKESDIRTFVHKEIGRQNITMSHSAIELLLQKSNFDIAEIDRNIQLLVAFKPDKCIHEEDVRVVLPKTLQDNVFDLSRYLLAGDIDAARNLAEDLRLQGEEEVKLLAILLSQFRLYLQIQCLGKKGGSESQIVSELSDILGRKMNPYQVKYALRDSRQLSMKLLIRIIRHLIEADFQIKQGRLDKADTFDVALLQIVSQK